MATGGVKWFSNEKGFGFLGQDGVTNIFCHLLAITGGGYRSPNEGERLEFEQGQKGLQAKNVGMTNPAPVRARSRRFVGLANCVSARFVAERVFSST